MFKTVIIVATLVAGAAHAEPLLGKKLAAGSSGQPFCTEMANLREYMIAAMTDDKVALKAIHREGNCGMLRSGTAITVLEDMPTADGDTDGMHPVKIRAIGAKGSSVGYTLSVGMVERS